MKETFAILTIVLGLLTAPLQGDNGCDGDVGTEVSGECESAFAECSDCIAIGVRSGTNRCGWCASTQTCETRASYYASVCSDGTPMSKEWCPVNAENRPFDGQDCLSVKWEYYYCTSTPSSVGTMCSGSFLADWCSMNKSEGWLHLCNGDRRKFSDGVMTGATIEKSPNGVLVHLVGGWKECWKYEEEPVENRVACHSSKKHALRYSLRLTENDASEKDSGITDDGSGGSSALSLVGGTCLAVALLSYLL